MHWGRPYRVFFLSFALAWQMGCGSTGDQPWFNFNDSCGDDWAEPQFAAVGGECLGAGPEVCPPGFDRYGDSCTARLPEAPCARGERAAIGSLTCVPLGPCGSPPWGELTDDGQTVFVDQSTDATPTDGSQLAPFRTLAEGLAAAATLGPGAQVALADGQYEGPITIDQPLRLSGRCAETVSLLSFDEEQPGITLTSAAAGSEIQGFAVYAAAVGIYLQSADQVRLRELTLTDAGGDAIVVEASGDASIVGCHLSQIPGAGLRVIGSAVGIENTEISEIYAAGQTGAGAGGRGIIALPDPSTGLPSQVWIRTSVLRRIRGVAVESLGSELVFSDSVLTSTRRNDLQPFEGWGIRASCDSTTLECGSLTMSGSEVSSSYEIGVAVMGTSLTLQGCTIRGAGSWMTDDNLGHAVHATCHADAGRCPVVDIIASTIAAAEPVEIYLQGASARLNQVLVTSGDAFDPNFGVFAQCDPNTQQCGQLEIERSLFRHVQGVAVNVCGVSGRISDSALEAINDSRVGDEVGVQVVGVPGAARTTFDIQSTVLTRIGEWGLGYVDADGTVSRTWIDSGQWSVGLAGDAHLVLASDNHFYGFLDPKDVPIQGYRPVPPPLLISSDCGTWN